MAHFRGTVRTAWSPVHAYDYMLDLAHFADWDPGVTRARRVVGNAPGLGAAYDVTVKTRFGEQTLRYETITADPPRRIEVRAETAMLVSLDVITVDPDGETGGCLVVYDADLSLKGIARVGEPILALAFRRIGERAVAGLREVLESPAVP